MVVVDVLCCFAHSGIDSALDLHCSKEREDGYYLSFWVFVISGGVGNLIDRILYGEVIDFMHLNFGIFKTGVFNVADLYLNVFALLVLLLYFIRIKKDGTDSHVDSFFS